MKIAASILDCDNRVEGVKKLNKTDISYIHIDVMDGNFVSRIQFSDIDEIKKINSVSKYPLDIHLMVDNPDLYIKSLSNMNIGYVTVHFEINKDLDDVFEQIRALGYKVGLSVKPSTDLKEIKPYLGMIDLVLLMSVEPGMGGQSFINNTVDKIKELKTLITSSDSNVLIEVDGGINKDTITKVRDVDISVVGSYIVGSDNYKTRVEELLNPFNSDLNNTMKKFDLKKITICGLLLLIIVFIIILIV